MILKHCLFEPYRLDRRFETHFVAIKRAEEMDVEGYNRMR